MAPRSLVMTKQRNLKEKGFIEEIKKKKLYEALATYYIKVLLVFVQDLLTI